MASATSDDGFHEIQLNGKQLVFLFMAVTVVSVVIFLCGVLVGRGVRLDAGAPEAIESQVAAAPPPPPAVVASPGPSAPATASEDLSYPKRLATGESKEQLKPNQPAQTVPPPQSAAPAPAAPAQAAATPSPTPAPAAPTAKPSAPPATPAAAPAPSEPAGVGFAIQLAALRQREEADIIARRLIGKGFPAYVLTPENGAPPVFRVRVGKFKDRREAETIAARLQKEEQFNPWIVR
jgi:cell division septation protein DedD